ncbi:dual specificity protein phosphatase PPS1 [Aulographum hederae CBS 113979]|uniref:Dual specificity protein phosphatase PPS1 n=1 Tax=Aulographum hederae CBS 113979 TaxID=1176131 RepID=A0A6G1HCU6_9PEZI|nr:dual specificity protein phosphatase PPS1 [Aulographum hederae CBS 113979]
MVARAPAHELGRSSTPPPHLTLNTSSRGTPAAIPNKHIPICSPGPRPDSGLDTPPSSPPKDALIETTSLLHPPDQYTKISDEPPVYEIDANTCAEALECISTQALPDPKLVFPWLHGLHADNQMQLAFFVARRKALRQVPRCIRGITVVKAGGDLSASKLKGAISPEDILCPHSKTEETVAFQEIDPREGFSVRNFQIQACKLATCSDIIVYGDDDTPKKEVTQLARKIARAQLAWKDRNAIGCEEMQVFNTFVVSDSFKAFERNHKELVAIDPQGMLTGEVIDFFHQERLEMCMMSEASEISNNVYLGPTPEGSCEPWEVNLPDFDVTVETSDLAPMPDSRTLRAWRRILESTDPSPLAVDFPSSGSVLPPQWSHVEVDGLMEMCRWIYRIANPDGEGEDESEKETDGDSIMMSTLSKSRKVLIHCSDGYTESSLLGLTYFMYAEGLPVHEAWVKLHRERGRNFFAYPSDVALLNSIQPRILQESPRYKESLCIKDPSWLPRLDGSLPSRILPYMYLGNLNHANNPELLKALGITKVLSVGEPVSWSKETRDSWPWEDLLYIDKVQDNGIDPLTEEFGRCLEFIEKGKAEGTATLVHCRVGVSRSATICIAEVMNEMGLSFPRAYCLVRARRLNVIIQPHLRFTYELLKWEELQRQRRGQPLRRELEWATIAREIALMNKPYSRQ